MRKRVSACASVLAGAALLVACSHTATRADVNKEAAEAQSRVDSATAVVERMKAEPTTAALLSKARGVLIVPDYGKGAWIVGGQGGAGVLMLRHHGEWGQPAFYILGGLSIGLQAGGEVGPIAMVLMSDKAVEAFETHSSRWSLGADAGLTVVNTSEHADIVGTTPPTDVVVWLGTKGLYGGLSVGASDMTPQESLDNAYYHRLVTLHDIMVGNVSNPGAAPLRTALTTRVAQQ